MFKAVIDEVTYLTLLEQRHAYELFELIDVNRDRLSQWLAFPKVTTEVKDTEKFIAKSLNRFASNNGYWAGIWYKGKLAGSIGYLYMDYSNNKNEIGWLSNLFQVLST